MTNEIVDGKITVKLIDPIEIKNQETITEITIVRPKAKHLRDMGTPLAMKDSINLIGKLSGLAMHVVDEISMADIGQITEAIQAFLPPGQTTGDKA